MEREKSIDGLRGLSCILIAFIYHTKFFEIFNVFPKFIVDGSQILCRLVEVFLAISGFGMACAYKNRIQNMTLREYFGKRYMKIYPLYFLTYILSAIIQYYTYFKTQKTLFGDFSIDLIHTVFGIFGFETGCVFGSAPYNGPAWTISVIFLCYIIYFIVCKISKGNQDKYMLLVIGILCFALSGVYRYWEIPFLYAENTLRGVGSFMMGAIIYEINGWNKFFGKALAFLFIGLAAIYCCLVIFSGNTIQKLMGGGTGERLLAILFLCPVALLSALNIKPIKWILERKPMLFLGKISMSLYLWHRLIQMLFILIMPDKFNTICGWFVYVIVVTIVSFVSNLFIEPQLQNLAAKLLEKGETYNAV